MSSFDCDPTIAVIAAIHEAAGGDIDPYELIGVLIEGVVHVIAAEIPIERQAECGVAAIQMVVNRLRNEQFI